MFVTIHWNKLVLVAVMLCAGHADSQQYGGRGQRMWRGGDSGPVQTEGGVLVNEDTVRTARETLPHVTETPNWTNSAGFQKDVFTFARIIYKSPGRPSFVGWVNDYPDSDLNLSFRLHQLTSMKVDPDGRVLKLSDPALFSYPFIFAAQAGGMELLDEEVTVLRRYLKNGGVFWADDFWGTRDWEHFKAQMARVLPDQIFQELTMEHQIFHCVFNFKGPMNSLQTPSIHFWRRNRDLYDPGATTSTPRGAGSDEMHVRAWLDGRKRVQVLATYNCDDGDGWEREAENEDFFHQFSETRAYPLAINVVFYIMTH
jgi:hypothetical protein